MPIPPVPPAILHDYCIYPKGKDEEGVPTLASYIRGNCGIVLEEHPPDFLVARLEDWLVHMLQRHRFVDGVIRVR